MFFLRLMISCEYVKIGLVLLGDIGRTMSMNQCAGQILVFLKNACEKFVVDIGGLSFLSHSLNLTQRALCQCLLLCGDQVLETSYMEE